ncbi:MAG: Flp pilus assembly protein CpaB, partial [Sphingomicrobium sp.]
LALAQTIGQLSLVLRKPGEEQNNPTVSTVSLNDLRYNLYSGSRYPQTGAATPQVVIRRAAPARRMPARAPRPPSTSKVEIVRGTTGNNYEVGRI